MTTISGGSKILADADRVCIELPFLPRDEETAAPAA
jgi:hypothetical protein